MNNTNEIVSQLSGYGSLIVNSLYFMVAGMLVIFLLYKIAHRYLYSRIKGKRLVTVIFAPFMCWCSLLPAYSFSVVLAMMCQQSDNSP